MPFGCDCPKSGAYLCTSCQALLTRVQGQQPVKAPEISERSFQARLLKGARELGWLGYHDYANRGENEAGFPDTFLAKIGQPMFAWELKKSRREKASIAQKHWLTVLPRTIGMQVGIYYPEDLDMLLEMLSRRGH